MLAWSLEACLAVESIADVIVAAPPGREEEVERLAAGFSGATVRVVTGGSTRAASVAAGLEEAGTALVAVHDAARPLATAALFAAVLATLVSRPDSAGVIAAAPLTDTVKRAGAPRAGEADRVRIAATERREELWAAQTPQAFRTGSLREAYATAGSRAAEATDEATLLEWAGELVLLEPAPTWNLKVTTAEDLDLAELLLAEMRNSNPRER